jgi:poly(3-hydroxybutyrate) depolymerase
MRLLLKHTFLFTILAFISMASCLSQIDRQPPGTVRNHTISIGQLERSFLLFLPQDYDTDNTPRPLILSYHGGGRTAERQLKLDQLTDPFFNRFSIILYPQGLNVCMYFLNRQYTHVYT